MDLDILPRTFWSQSDRSWNLDKGRWSWCRKLAPARNELRVNENEMFCGQVEYRRIENIAAIVPRRKSVSKVVTMWILSPSLEPHASPFRNTVASQSTGTYARKGWWMTVATPMGVAAVMGQRRRRRNRRPSWRFRGVQFPNWPSCAFFFFFFFFF